MDTVNTVKETVTRAIWGDTNKDAEGTTGTESYPQRGDTIGGDVGRDARSTIKDPGEAQGKYSPNESSTTMRGTESTSFDAGNYGAGRTFDDSMSSVYDTKRSLMEGAGPLKETATSYSLDDTNDASHDSAKDSSYRDTTATSYLGTKEPSHYKGSSYTFDNSTDTSNNDATTSSYSHGDLQNTSHKDTTSSSNLESKHPSTANDTASTDEIRPNYAEPRSDDRPENRPLPPSIRGASYDKTASNPSNVSPSGSTSSMTEELYHVSTPPVLTGGARTDTANRPVGGASSKGGDIPVMGQNQDLTSMSSSNEPSGTIGAVQPSGFRDTTNAAPGSKHTAMGNSGPGAAVEPSVSAAPPQGPEQKHQGATRPIESPNSTGSGLDKMRKKFEPLVAPGGGGQSLPAGMTLSSAPGISEGTGTKYEKSTGLTADGGDFDAARPGAGREAGRLLDETGDPHGGGQKKDVGTALGERKLGMGGGHHDGGHHLGHKLKEKLHIGHKQVTNP